jgi:RNA polymerase sigma factor (sigma-70 family)
MARRNVIEGEMPMYEADVSLGLHREHERRPRLERRSDRVRSVAREATRATVEPGPAAGGAAPEFEVAWALHARSVYERWLLLMSARRDDADEAFSRASFTAFQKYASHRRGIGNVRHWLLRLAHNVCMDLYRERSRYARLCDLEPADSESIVAIDADHRPADPEASLLREEQLAVLRAAIDRLPARLRGPLELRLGEELPDRRIAEVLHLTEATVRKRLQEARTALKPALLAYRRGDGRTPAITNGARATSVQREPERLAAPAGDQVGRPPRRFAEASATANAERR